MSQDNTIIEDMKHAMDNLPDDVREQLLGGGEPPIDPVAVKMELVKFVTELLKHNQACDWETNKIKPKRIGIDDVISGSQKLYDFLTE